MINALKRYWPLLLIVFIAINILGFCFIKESIGISDALEHADSNEMIERLRAIDFTYSIINSLFLILDITIILLAGYLLIMKLFKLNRHQ